MGSPVELRILVVCAANQCRSRVAEAVLRHELRHHPGITITSAGTRVMQPQPMCADAHRFLTRHAPSAHVEATTPAERLTSDHLTQADLVLVMDRTIRAEVVALDADARKRTYAMRDAAGAAQYLLDQQLVHRARIAHAQGHPYLSGMVDGQQRLIAETLKPRHEADWLQRELAAAMGLRPISHEGSDIRDAHEGRFVRHAPILSAVLEACTPVSRLLEQIAESDA